LQREKNELLRIAEEIRPRGPADWERVAVALEMSGSGVEEQPAASGTAAAAAAAVVQQRAGSSARRMYRSLTGGGAGAGASEDGEGGDHPLPLDKSSPTAAAAAGSTHGRRINPRGGTPMRVMAAAALASLPGKRGNLTEIADAIQRVPAFSSQLDWSPRPGTKTYPRWKDALVGCFKAGRYPHLQKTGDKHDGLNVYALVGEPPIDRKHLEALVASGALPRDVLADTAAGGALARQPSRAAAGAAGEAAAVVAAALAAAAAGAEVEEARRVAAAKEEGEESKALPSPASPESASSGEAAAAAHAAAAHAAAAAPAA
jgi:hypothetical protein